MVTSTKEKSSPKYGVTSTKETSSPKYGVNSTDVGHIIA